MAEAFRVITRTNNNAVNKIGLISGLLKFSLYCRKVWSKNLNHKLLCICIFNKTRIKENKPIFFSIDINKGLNSTLK